MRRDGSVKGRGACSEDWPREGFHCLFRRCWRWLCRRNRIRRKTKRRATRPYCQGEVTMKTLTRRGIVLTAAVLLAACGCFAQQAPDTAAGKQFAAWLEGFNSGGRATLLPYLEKNYPQRAKDSDGMLQFRAMTGGFELKKVESSEATKLTTLVKEKDSDQFARLTMEVEEAEQ